MARLLIRYVVPLIAATAVVGVFVGTSSAASARGVRASGPTNVYDSSLADVKVRVKALSNTHGHTLISLTLSRMPKATWGKTFGAHVHTRACGSDPEAAGPHYVNPRAAADAPLRDKEIWLDFTVRRGGLAHSRVVAHWPIEKGTANSIVIHTQPTDEMTGKAGTRAVCTTVGLGTVKL